MDQERWRKIESVFQTVCEMPAAERASYLAEVCAGDAALQSEIESLLAANHGENNLLEGAVWQTGLQVLANGETPLRENQKFGIYRILKLIGSGGMSQVYLAQDTRLGRNAALKILSEHLVATPENVRRFQHEARTASVISHPNVAHVYEFGEQNGFHYIAMEYVKGVMLRDLLDRERLEIRRILEIFIQVFKALNAAHEAGVIHRDIKPENIIVCEDGTIKVLDFGIAKFQNAAVSDETLTAKNSLDTAQGLIKGTIAYMSPEQVRGKNIDCRTDLWSAGVVLYEALTGARPFSGQTVSDVRAAILLLDSLNAEDLNTELADTALPEIIRRLLAKNAAERYQNSVDVLTDLRRALRKIDEDEIHLTFQANAAARNPPDVVSRNFNLSGIIIAAAFLLLGGAAFGFWQWQSSVNSKSVNTFAGKNANFEQPSTVKNDAAAPAARELYLRGRFFWNKRTKDGYFKAIDNYRQALEIEPNYALAYAGIAETYHLLGDYSYLAPNKAFPLARDAARKALEINPNLAEAHTSLAYAEFLYDWDWTAAETEFRRALELKPDDATAHQWYAEFLAAMNRPQEAEREIAAAYRLDPNSLSIQSSQCWLLYVRNDVAAAVKKCRETVELDPNFYPAHFFLGLALSIRGLPAESIESLETAARLSGENVEVLAHLGFAYGKAGRRQDALRVMSKLDAKKREMYISPYFYGLIYAGINDEDKAFKYLDAAVEQRARAVSAFKVEPLLQDLRGDKRFADLLRRINL